MFVVDGLGYVILAGTVALGGFAGWLSGWLLSTLLRVKRRGPADALSGIAGSLIGTYLSFLGFSVHEEWYDGRLVSRHVGGWADHFVLIGILCSVALVATVKICSYFGALLFRKH